MTNEQKTFSYSYQRSTWPTNNLQTGASSIQLLSVSSAQSIVLEKGDHRVFYIKPDTVFLEEPRVQNLKRAEFLKQISQPPQPEPFCLMADDLHKAMIEDIRDMSSPDTVREMMAKFFTRRQYKLQHKKHKYLSRWSHFALTSELVDKVSIKFSPNYSKI